MWVVEENLTLLLLRFVVLEREGNQGFMHVVDQLFGGAVMQPSAPAMRTDADHVHVVHLREMHHAMLDIGILNGVGDIFADLVQFGEALHVGLDLLHGGGLVCAHNQCQKPE